jgi:general nucleoside transport system permease protein
MIGNVPQTPPAAIQQETQEQATGAVKSAAAARRLRGALVPLLALLTALIFCGLLLLITGHNPLTVYQALWTGAITGNQAFANTLVQTTPYILLGLAVAIAFKASLFNIGTAGQLVVGALATIWASQALPHAPGIVQVIFVLLAGTLAGALYASIAGILKVVSGAHEVITTIMLNYIALYGLQWLVDEGGVLHGSSQIQQSYYIPTGAYLPIIWPGTSLHAGLLIALAIAALTTVLLWRTTWGFELRAVGLNPFAARSAGISIRSVTLWSMALSGALAGLAGAIQIAGLQHVLPDSFDTQLAYDSIAVAIIGGGNPAGIVLAALLLGALKNGQTNMELNAGISGPFVSVIEAAILFFVAAPVIIRWLYFRWNLRRTGTPSKRAAA